YEKLPAVLRPAIALLIALPCGLFLPQVLGGGQGLIKLSENAQAGLVMMGLFLTVKLVFTCTSFGSGLPGGIFMPILSVGALTGGLFGQLLMGVGLPADCLPAFCVCAMAGAMASSVKAPVTSILLMAEMTGSLIHLLPVATVAFIALLTSDLLGVSPIYEVLLERIRGNQEDKQHKPARRNTLVEMPVEMGSPVDGQLVRDIPWPDGALIIAIHRGDKEFIPNGNTQILPGDYLVAASSKQRFEQMNQGLMKLCRTP
ncbi:MAG TPA: chloride channel protein, partial [Candidatus Limiplasma sp.]|nr:chloride channel protein [Candidatus Limiplasma sp.]